MEKAVLLQSGDYFHQFKHCDETYTYPRVTSVISAGGFNDFAFVPNERMEASRKFGQKVHLACEYWDNEILDEENLDRNLQPWLNGWRKFRQEIPWAKKIKLSETIVFSKTWGYAGILDRVFNGGILVDIKTGVVDKVAGLQMAAYAEALRQCLRIDIKKRFVVQLQEETYKLHEFKDRADLDRFYACLTIYNFKQTKGGLRL